LSRKILQRAFFDNRIDSYDYDAFGNLINSTGATPDVYLFAGEQYDPALGLYYNRARYLNTATGRFWTADTVEGQDQRPLTLHKYLYADANPVDGTDPSGNQDSMAELGVEESVSMTINAMPVLQLPHAAAYPVVVVTLPNGNSYEPESEVKNPRQASISKALQGLPIRIAVPDSVDPQALVNEWRGKLSWWNGPVTYARFGWYWRPGGPHDYKQGPGNAIYDAFGNFEFGATGAAAGFDEQTLEEAAEAVKGGSNSVINELDILQGFLAIKDGATLSKRLESLSPL
jgi:RHS repeat-associated protein